MIQKKIIITNYQNKICSFLIDDGKMLRIHVTDSELDLLSNIYIAKVKKINKNINAAFVEISAGQMAFLPLENLKYMQITNRRDANNLREGDELPVQLIREATANKDPLVTTNLSLGGTYCVVSLERHAAPIQFSKKIHPKRKTEISEYIRNTFKVEMKNTDCEKEYSAPFLPFGIVIRTKAAELSDLSILITEIHLLSQKLAGITQNAAYRTCYSRLYQSVPGYISFINGLPTDTYEQIVTDIPEVYAALSENFPNNSFSNTGIPFLSLYDDSYSLANLYSLKSKMDEVLNVKQWLPSGASVFIESTEAMTVIDVNTGKCILGKKKEETILKINLEAAKYIARQMILRNLSGIIIIDFINMQSKEQKQVLIQYMKNLLKEDPLPCDFIDITPLGLMEITRKKISKPIREHFFKKHKD